MKDITKIKQPHGFYMKLMTGSMMLFSLFLVHPMRAQLSNTLTWNAAINRALEANLNLASARADLEASSRNVSIARAGYLPGLDITGTLSQSESSNYSETFGILPSTTGLIGGTISQMIYNQKTLANHKIQKFYYASNEEQYRNTRYGTISTTGQAYIGVLIAGDLLRIQEINMAVTRRNLQAAKDQFEVGSTDRQEVLRWETQLFANEQEVNSQRASLLINMGNLNQILNLPIETRGDLEPLTVAKDGFIFSSAIVTEMVSDPEKTRIIRDYLVELGLTNSPLLAGFQLEIEAQSTQIKSDKRWAVPNLSFNASAGTKWLQEGEGSDSSSTNNTGTWQVGMSLDWPIVSGNANVARVKQAKSQLSSLDYQKTDIKTTLDLNIRSSAAVVISDYINMGFANAQAEAARENYDLVYDSYMVGESTLLDFIDAQQQKLDADISATLALYTFFADLIATELEISFFPFLQQPDQVAAIVAELENRLLIN